MIILILLAIVLAIAAGLSMLIIGILGLSYGWVIFSMLDILIISGIIIFKK